MTHAVRTTEYVANHTSRSEGRPMPRRPARRGGARHRRRSDVRETLPGNEQVNVKNRGLRGLNQSSPIVSRPDVQPAGNEVTLSPKSDLACTTSPQRPPPFRAREMLRTMGDGLDKLRRNAVVISVAVFRLKFKPAYSLMRCRSLQRQLIQRVTCIVFGAVN